MNSSDEYVVKQAGVWATYAGFLLSICSNWRPVLDYSHGI